MTPMAKVIAELVHETRVEARSALLQRWFAGQAWFWKYSARNVAMILAQVPDARQVLTARAWKKLGRRVRKHEEPIWLLAPTWIGRSYTGRPFIFVPVFDVRQTKGRRYVVPSVSMAGDSPVLSAVERAGRRLKIKVTEFEARKGLYGRMLNRHHVEIARGLSAADRAATLIHEYAHALLHSAKRGKKTEHLTAEIQAEGAAYVVLKALGQPTTAPRYLALHLGDVGAGEIEASMREIARASREIIRAIRRRR